MKNKLLAVVIAVSDILKSRGHKLPAELNARISTAAKNEEYYEQALFQAVQDRYDGKTTDIEFLLLFGLLINEHLRRAYEDGLRDAGYEGKLDGEMEMELQQLQMEDEAYAGALLAALLVAISAGTSVDLFRSRVATWAHRYEDVRNRAIVTGGRRINAKLIWVVGQTEHCGDCKSYNKQVKTAGEWHEIWLLYGHRPQARALQCHGYRCQCKLLPI